MNWRTKPRAQSDAEHPDESAGRIAFRLRIGVTGHRELPDEARLTGLVRQELRRLVGQLHASSSATVELVVISQLADGADRLVVREVLDLAEERGQQAGRQTGAASSGRCERSRCLPSSRRRRSECTSA